jgi:hypothetical protein
MAAFPAGYNLDRSSGFVFDDNVSPDEMSDGSTYLRTTGATQYITIRCVFKYLTLAEKNTLTAFLFTNKATVVTWTIDSIDYSGYFKGGHSESMSGNRYSVRFTYRAEVV